MASLRSLSSDFAYLKSLVEEKQRDADDLRNTLKEIYQAIYLADFRSYDPDHVREDAEQLLSEIFAVRLLVRRRIDEWVNQGFMTRPVQSALRDCFRASRYAGDLIGEVALGHPRLAEGQAGFAAFSGTTPNLVLNPQFASEGFAFKPGDVLLERGMLHNSAAIARIGDVDSQFSHLAIVAKDEKGELVVVEALIEDGAVITPLRRHLGHQIGRAVLFRHRDQGLAERAAQFIHDHVAARLTKGNGPILYDFTMELAGYDELFCSKLVRYAYERGSNGAITLPPFTTLLDMKNRDFVSRVGVTARETFAPGDMELAPDFDVVAEWCDFRVTSELRIKDLIMTKLFEWAELHGYRFQPDLTIRFIALGGRLSTRLSKQAQSFVASVVAKVPPNMSTRTIGAVAMLHLTAEPLYRELNLLNDEMIRASGRPMHPREVFAELERIRLRSGGRIGYLRH